MVSLDFLSEAKEKMPKHKKTAKNEVKDLCDGIDWSSLKRKKRSRILAQCGRKFTPRPFEWKELDTPRFLSPRSRSKSDSGRMVANWEPDFAVPSVLRVRTKPQAPRPLQLWLSINFSAGVNWLSRGGICAHDAAGLRNGRHRPPQGQAVSRALQGCSQLSTAEGISGREALPHCCPWRA